MTETPKDKRPRAPKQRLFIPCSPKLTEEVKAVVAQSRLPVGVVVAMLSAAAEQRFAGHVAEIIHGQLAMQLQLSQPLPSSPAVLPSSEGTAVEDGVA